MIISVSRRTDIPAFYADWFYNRLRAGYVLVRNPMNLHSVSKVRLTADVVDAFVFWTKNPLPMARRLDELATYPYYFQFTLTGYGADIEPGVPDKRRVLLHGFKDLSARLGKKQVIWRYDPIFFSKKYTPEYHLVCFEVLAAELHNSTERCVISFMDSYRNTKRNAQQLDAVDTGREELYDFAGQLAKIAAKYGIKLQTCAESMDLTALGITPSACIDKALLEDIGSFKLDVKKDANQRAECCCAASIDIGAYNTCPGGCLYCYANYNAPLVQTNIAAHDKTSPLLFGTLTAQDVVTERKMKSCKIMANSLF